MIDDYGRSIDYVRISLIDKCNIRCIYCMPEKGAYRVSDNNLEKKDILKVVRALAKLGIKKVRYTGGEPLLFEGLDSLIYETARIPGIEDISITTNGILLYNKIEALRNAGLKRLNINISSLNREKYERITRGGELEKVLKGLDRAISLGFSPIKINTVLIKGINDDDIEQFINLSAHNPVEVRFIELMPIGEGKFYYDNGGRMSCEEIIAAHGELQEIPNPKSGNVRLFKMDNAIGTIGFIEPISNKFCINCSKIRMTSYGSIKPCLHSAEEINIKDFLNDEERLMEVLRASILAKSKEHHLDKENASRSAKQMFQIGG